MLDDYVEGTLSGEKAWVAAYMDQAYFWYREIPQVDANAAPYGDADAHYASVDAYFRALRTKAINLDGSDKDRFSFTYPTADYNRLLRAGVIYGYGVEWRNASNTPPRNIRAAYVEAGTSGAQAGILRGDRAGFASEDQRHHHRRSTPRCRPSSELLSEASLAVAERAGGRTRI